MESLINIASTIAGIDYRASGLNAKWMGLEGKTLKEIHDYFS